VSVEEIQHNTREGLLAVLKDNI